MVPMRMSVVKMKLSLSGFFLSGKFFSPPFEMFSYLLCALGREREVVLFIRFF